MSFMRHRSSAASHHDRLSYIHGPDQSYSTECLYTFDPRKNLNDLFQSVSMENVCMENLRVYLRVRPRLEGEVQQNEDTQVDIIDDRSVILTAPTCSNTFKNSVRGISKLTHKFTFTHVYGPSTTQEDLFRSSSLNLVTDFVSGQNCLLFTYGATNSGKTFTVQGTPEDAGLLPRTVQHIFNLVGENHYPRNDLKPKFCCKVTRLEEQDVIKEEEKRESIFKIPSNLTTTFSQSTLSILKASMSEDSVNTTEYSTTSHNTTEAGVSPVLDSTNDTTGDLTGLGTTLYAVFVSFAEIYNEYIFDLLEKIPTSKGKRNPLMLGEDYDGAVYIKGLNEVRVRTAEEAMQLVNIGRQNLHFAATRLNHNSSRSHCIFTVKLVRLADADNPHFARVSVMSLCDLAGAERAAKTWSTQDRLKESGNINTSLLTLSRCIEALRCNQTQKGSKKVPVPYRDSKLTRLFQSFLLGKGRAAMIVNISKLPLLFDETLQVLKFSAVAKQVTITQARESEMQVVQPSRRVSRLSKMVRQSLKGNGRLSVPWAKGKGSITFGESVCEEKGDKEQEIEQEDLLEEEEDEDDEEEDERVEGLIQLINKLKEELVREHQEKLDLEERLRRELCKEFSQQLVEIQNSWSQRLKDQENLYEELTECKIQALMKSVKKCNKRMRCEEDPDEEYVSSVFLFREQQKVAEQKQEIEELKANENLLKEEVKALKDSQKKINEMATQAKEEKSRLTFRLAQLTATYDKVVQELEEAKSLSVSASTDNTEVIQELRVQLEKRTAQLAEQNHEIQDLQTMLVEASEYCTSKEDLCSNLEKLLESSRLKNTQHMMYINDVESQLEESRSMLSQQAAQMEEREQDIEDLRQLLSQERKSRKEELSKMEEDYVREKSKLLLEVAGLKRNKPAEDNGNGEEVKLLAEKVSQLQEEKEALKKSSESMRERQEQETIEKDKYIKSLEEELVMMEKQLSQKETDIKKEREEKEIKVDELKKIQESVLHQEELKGEKVAEIDRLMQDNEALSSQLQCLKACNEALNSECEDIKSCLKEKKDAEVKLQEDFTACRAKLEELEKAYGSLKKMEDAQVKLQEDLDKSTAEVQELVKANISLKEQVNAKAEMEELQKAHTLLKKEIDAKTDLQENLNTCQMQLEALQTTHTSLEEEREDLRQKLQDQTNLLEKLKAESEGEAGKNSAVCEKLRAEIEELKMMKVGQDNAVQEVSELKVRLEAQVEQIKEEKSQVQIQVEMLELDKKKMGERLHNLQEASHLKAQQAQIEIETLQEQIEILMKDKIALEAKVEAAQRQTQEQISLVQQKQEVMQALSSKIESLDAKLNRAEEEKEDKKQLEEEVKASKAKIIRLDTKCELLEKEVLALREARQAEVQESFNRTKDHEEFARQKEAEISTLQQEVKKLLQQSMCSSRSSIADPPPVKAEVAGPSDELLNLKEELRLAVAHNSTLKQEVSSLRDQVARQSTSSDIRILQVSSSKPSQKNRRDASTSDKEGFVTPVPKERKGRRGRPAMQTSNTSACLDSSVGDERPSYASPVISSPPPAPTSSSGRPQRTTRRTMRYDSEEYVLDYRPRGDDDRAWEPRLKAGRTKPHKSKVSGVSKSILQDQENKSSMANKADMIPGSDAEPEIEPKTGTGRKKTSTTRRRRVLYNSDDFEEPFLCAPELVCEAPEDSPMTTVRRQLRTKKK